MCIGLPMQVVSVSPGHALCEGRGMSRRVRTALVGEVERGDWLLVFLDSAQERIDAARAAEIGATLDLLQAALAGANGGEPFGDAFFSDASFAGAQDGGAAAASTPPDPGFELPSRWTAEQLRALSGAAHPERSEEFP